MMLLVISYNTCRNLTPRAVNKHTSVCELQGHEDMERMSSMYIVTYER